MRYVLHSPPGRWFVVVLRGVSGEGTGHGRRASRYLAMELFSLPPNIPNQSVFQDDFPLSGKMPRNVPTYLASRLFLAATSPASESRDWPTWGYTTATHGNTTVIVPAERGRREGRRFEIYNHGGTDCGGAVYLLEWRNIVDRSFTTCHPGEGTTYAAQ